MSVLNKIARCTFVGSTQLFAGRRWFSNSFKKFSFLFLTFKMGSTSPFSRYYAYYVFMSLFVGSVRAARNSSGRMRALQSTLRWQEIMFIEFQKKIRLSLFTLQMGSTWLFLLEYIRAKMTMLSASVNWKTKMQFFWNFQEMISCLRRADSSRSTFPEVLLVTWTYPMNIAKKTHKHIIFLKWPCWVHLQTDKQKCHFKQTFRKWSAVCVEPIKTGKYVQKCCW